MSDPYAILLKEDLERLTFAFATLRLMLPPEDGSDPEYTDEEQGTLALTHCQEVAMEAIEKLPEECNTHAAIMLVVGKALCEDFMCAADPVINPDPEDKPPSAGWRR